MNTALLLLPDFALILLGAAIRRWMHLGDHFWSGVEKLVYFILFPALLINAIIKTQLDISSALPLLATALAAMAAGFLLNLAGFVPPAPLQAFLGRLADASIALGLITVGAALRLESSPGVKGYSLWLVAVKLLALPLVASVVGVQMGLSGLNYQVVVLFAALPTASSAYILAMRMGGDGKSVAWLISATTLGSMLTLPLWAAWLARL